MATKSAIKIINSIDIETYLEGVVECEAGDAQKLVTLSNASGITLTVPPSVFAAGNIINIQQIGAGQVTLAQGAGVTITSTGSGTGGNAPKIAARYGAASIICTASNVFTVIGGLS